MKILGYGFMGVMVVILSGIGFIYYTEGAEAFSTKTVRVHEQQEIHGEEIDNLKINTGSVDVKVAPGKTESITIELDGEVSEKMKDSFKLTANEKDGTLNVHLERDQQTAFTVFSINKHTQLTIGLPEKLYEKILLETTSGDISVQNVTSQNIELESTSGDIHTEKLEGAASLSIESTSGDIEALDFSFKKAALKSTSGDIYAGNATAIKTLSVKSTSGDVVVEPASEAYSLNVQTNSGDGEINTPGLLFEEKTEKRVIGKKGNGELSIEITTTSGDYQLK